MRWSFYIVLESDQTRNTEFKFHVIMFKAAMQNDIYACERVY